MPKQNNPKQVVQSNRHDVETPPPPSSPYPFPAPHKQNQVMQRKKTRKYFMTISLPRSVPIPITPLAPHHTTHTDYTRSFKESQQCCRACRSLQAWGWWPRHRSRRTQQAVRRRCVPHSIRVWRTVRVWRRVCRHRRRLVLAQVCGVGPGRSVLLLGARRGASRCRWDVLRRSAGLGGRATSLPDMHCACRRGGSPHRRHRRRLLLAATS